MQARHIVDKIWGNLKGKFTYKNMSTLIFFKPEVAAVGRNKKQLQSTSIPYKVAYYSNEPVNRTIAMRNTKGFVKLIISNDGKNRILGMRAVNPQASTFTISIPVSRKVLKNVFAYFINLLFSNPKHFRKK